MQPDAASFTVADATVAAAAAAAAAAPPAAVAAAVAAAAATTRFRRILPKLCPCILAQILQNLAKSVPTYTGTDFAKACKICAEVHWHRFCKILQNPCRGMLLALPFYNCLRFHLLG